MDNQEFKYLIINTPELWKLSQAWKHMRIGEEGLELAGSFAYVYSEVIIAEEVFPLSLAYDNCDYLFLAETRLNGSQPPASSSKILIYDLKQREIVQHLDCHSFSSIRSIALCKSDLYVLDNEKVLCMARVNWQLRWEKEVEHDLKLTGAGAGMLYILDLDTQEVYRTGREWNLQKLILKNQTNEIIELSQAVDIASDSDRYFYILTRDTREILLFDENGILAKTIPVLYEAEFVPVALTIDHSGKIYLSFEDLSGIVLQERVTFYPENGYYITQAQDSTEVDMHWHKLNLDRDIPPNTQIKIHYYASNNNNLPLAPPWSGPLSNPQDALLSNARGQYIWFKIELVSDERKLNTPLIRSLRVDFPRLSYLRYLPAIYQENEASRDFLERFFSLFETYLYDNEMTITRAVQYLDPLGTPKDFLKWLAQFSALSIDENWPEDRIRLLIQKAVQLYKKRGTREGLTELLELILGIKLDRASILQVRQALLNQEHELLQDLMSQGLINDLDVEFENYQRSLDEKMDWFSMTDPIIIEPFQTRCGDQNLAQLTELYRSLYSADPFQFMVIIRPFLLKSEAERSALVRAIEANKPAHTRGCLKTLQPNIYLDFHCYLGVNTLLTRPEFRLGKTSVISRDTSLDNPEPSGQLSIRGRLDIDTTLA